MDEDQIVYYDSNTRTLNLKKEWVKNCTANEPHYWMRETERLKDQQDWFKSKVPTLMKIFNQTEGETRADPVFTSHTHMHQIISYFYFIFLLNVKFLSWLSFG